MWLGPVLLKALIFFPLGSLSLLCVIVSCRPLSFTVTLKDPYEVGATEYIYLSIHYVLKAIITISQLTFTGHQALAKDFNEAGQRMVLQQGVPRLAGLDALFKLRHVKCPP